MRSRLTAFAAVLLLNCLASESAGHQDTPKAGSLPASDNILERSRAKYATLRSYADTGSIVTEYQSSGGPMIVERDTFRTYYRAPRKFYFDFNKDPNAGGDRMVIWCDGGDFQSWWLATGVHERYESGQGATAFAVGSLPTNGSVLGIPPLLFAQAGLHGPIVDIKETRAAGAEDVGGHRCHKVTGEVGLAYGTGQVTSTLTTTVWIDAETLLIRKIFVDTPRGSPAGTISRGTTTFEPQADPALDDSRFRFTVPTGQK